MKIIEPYKSYDEILSIPNILKIQDSWFNNNSEALETLTHLYKVEILPTKEYEMNNKKKKMFEKSYLFYERLYKDLWEEREFYLSTVSKDRRIQLYARLFRAINFISKNGFVHLDIKSQNVMMSCNPLICSEQEFILKIIDFGFLTP